MRKFFFQSTLPLSGLNSASLVVFRQTSFHPHRLELRSEESLGFWRDRCWVNSIVIEYYYVMNMACLSAASEYSSSLWAGRHLPAVCSGEKRKKRRRARREEGAEEGRAPGLGEQ